ncbi:MAG: outer membrane protein assembly factor BamD [Maricaulaceae bacterium]
MDIRGARSILVACAWATGLLGLSACASDKREALQFVATPAETLFLTGREELDRRRYDEAILQFDEVERQHPYSEWARRAILLSAYSAYQANQYEEAITTAERFIALHPGSVSTPYAFHLIAQSHFERITDVGRDQRTTELALGALNQVVQRYPETDYATDARIKIDMVRSHLAGKEMEVGRFYLSKNHHLAAIKRFKRVIDEYQDTIHVEEALHRLTEAYASLGVMDEAIQTAAVLGYNYPGGEWYERSYKVIDREMNREPTGEAAAGENRGIWGATLGRVF